VVVAVSVDITITQVHLLMVIVVAMGHLVRHQLAWELYLKIRVPIPKQTLLRTGTEEAAAPVKESSVIEMGMRF